MASAAPTYHRSEDAAKYRANASFVYNGKNTAPVLELLDAKVGENVLDIGCGSGELTQEIAKILTSAGSMVGLDGSPNMIAAARSSAGASSFATISYDVTDCCSLSSYLTTHDRAGSFDKVFSNAALHWMKSSPAGVMTGGMVRMKALKPGGTFAAEMGGFLNVMGIRSGLHAILRRHGIDPERIDPWWFPTPEAMTALLTSQDLYGGSQPFEVMSCELVARPTPLPTGLRGWIESFGGSFMNALPSNQAREAAIKELEDLLRVDTYDSTTQIWYAMYYRLRFKARKPLTPSSSASAPDLPPPSTLLPSSHLRKFLNPSPTANTAAASLRNDFVNKLVRVHIRDQRAFSGVFTCVDDAGNLILMEASEERFPGSESGSGSFSLASTAVDPASTRLVGTIMIKGSDIVKVEVKCNDYSPPTGIEGLNAMMVDDQGIEKFARPFDPANYL